MSPYAGTECNQSAQKLKTDYKKTWAAPQITGKWDEAMSCHLNTVIIESWAGKKTPSGSKI
jgi:hypothetical protein